MHWVTATDENDRDFAALTDEPNPAGEDKVGVWVFIDGENGWGANVGELTLKHLKKLSDGKFGA